MKKKLFTLMLMVVAIMGAQNAKAQTYLPFVNDNYAGITAVGWQPASLADSRYKFDMTIVGVNFSTYNNYVYLQNKYWADAKKDSGYDLRERFLQYSPLLKEGQTAYIYQDAQVDVLNFMVSINPRFTIGFGARIREHLNVDNVSRALAGLAFNGGLDGARADGTPWVSDEDGFYVSTDWYDPNDPHHVINEKNIRVNMSVWAEYGVSFAGVILGQDKNGAANSQHYLAAGATMKILQGLGSAYIYASNANYSFINGDSVHFDNTEVHYGLSETADKDYFDNFTFNNMGERLSVGFDLGVVYEWRPDYKKYNYITRDGSEKGLRTENKYKLKVGLSLTDLGSVKYKKGNNSADFIIDGTLDISQWRQNFQDLETFNDDLINKDKDGIVTKLDDGETYYRMSLPTQINLQVDYNIWKNFYINLSGSLAMRQAYTKYSKVHGYNAISITPRYERRWFGVAIPLQYNQFAGFAVGLGLRLGPVWIGSNNLVSTIASGKTKNANVQALLKLPIFQPRLKDRDGDGFLDKEDDCPDEFGLPQFVGCPDRDGDGIMDKEDDCPDDPGLAEFNGCPDTDGDGIMDKEDECPLEFGPKENNGCPWPDRDGDGIPDKDDDCPDEPGLPQFNGCPDRDGDGIMDKEDDCPDEPGLPQFNGCPDRDGDGVPDKTDKCPDEPGKPENDGCPIYEKVSFSKHINFEVNKSNLTADSYKWIDKLYDIMVADSTCWVKLDGHTDNSGNDAINDPLSQARVDVIKDYLVQKGIDPKRIVAKGHGSHEPLVPNTSKANKAKNRRTEINIAR